MSRLETKRKFESSSCPTNIVGTSPVVDKAHIWSYFLSERNSLEGPRLLNTAAAERLRILNIYGRPRPEFQPSSSGRCHLSTACSRQVNIWATRI